ncbi:MAG: RagB/SusD family nutrient uptake outer membrane protein [Chitinophagaceae bacterium]|nr:RagB/SusD family nutrient uptake outer membrane protein [Chitinophagaceae bacterium]
MKKIAFSIVSLATLGVITWSCSKSFLERKPLGGLDATTLANKKGVEALLDGFVNGGGIFLGGWQSSGTNWVYGSVVGGEAHKGSDAGDQPDVNSIESFTSTATNGYYGVKYNVVYEGVARSNSVLKQLAAATDVSDADRKRIEGEARFLRGHYHFEAKKMWNKVPYVDETITDFNLTNDADIWPQIEADLKFAYDNLPATMNAKGRVNKWAAGALYGKALLYQQKFGDAKAVLDAVYTNGTNAQGQKYALLARFSDNFNADTKNSTESVFAVQYSVNDGSAADNGGWGEVLNFPYTGGPGTCCGFFQPSQDLVNSYQVDPTTGLPDPANYNATEVKNDQGLRSTDPFTPHAGTLDARLDWTVGRRGIPYLDWGKHPGFNWQRDQAYAGPYSPIKNTYYSAQTGVRTDRSFWTSGITANNYTLIRFADVILMLAECEVETGGLERARELVNLVRARAANNDGWVKDASTASGFAAEYKVGIYTTPWTSQADARAAVRFERKLELGMEGHRFFDLVRWGVAATEINRILDYNSGKSNPAINNKRNYLVSADFTANKHEYFPIPQSAIDRSTTTDGTVRIKQNPGY